MPDWMFLFWKGWKRLGVDKNWRVSFPFLLFGYLNPSLILIEIIRFLFRLFSITKIN
jgi:hypothetical protein